MNGQSAGSGQTREFNALAELGQTDEITTGSRALGDFGRAAD
jgi:hypothetical protein